MFEKKETESAEHNKWTDDYNVISDAQFESNRIKSEDSNVPVLVCMTFADRLLAEMLDEDGKYNEGRAKKDIAKHFEVSICVVCVSLLKPSLPAAMY